MAEEAEKPKETKGEKFERLSLRRLQRVLERLAQLKRCGNRNVYAYTEVQKNYILGQLEAEVAEVRRAFTVASAARAQLCFPTEGQVSAGAAAVRTLSAPPTTF